MMPAALADSPRFRRLVEHVTDLGPRAVAELLAGAADFWDIPDDDMLERLERFNRIDQAMLVATGGDRFAPAPLRCIPGGRD